MKNIEQILAEFDKMTPDFIEGDLSDVDKWLCGNKNLCIEEAYPENMIELDRDKVKQFLLQSLTKIDQQAREDERKKVLRSLPKEKTEKNAINPKALDCIGFNQCLKEIKDNLNKLK